MLPEVTYTTHDLRLIAELTASYHVDGHRADIVILKAALANAAFNGRSTIEESDILQAAELALPHRLKRHPFEDTETNLENLQSRLDEAQSRAQAQQEAMAAGEGEKKT
jgi:Mg-chelatase subunit ChlI